MSAITGFPMPQAIVVDESTATSRYAKFIAAPLQSGFGHTIGNALRRVLLSSLDGAAICAVRIDGAAHEFVSLPGVVEDVTEIVLNLKNVRLKLLGEPRKTLEIRHDKAGAVTAADIVADGTVEVLNPEQVICTLDSDRPFRAEIDVVTGRGYEDADNASAVRTLGNIPVGCQFSPVDRVDYTVGAARVGEKTEMDSLEISIWTDGRIAPADALTRAAEILKEHLTVFLGGQKVEVNPKDELSQEEQRQFRLLSQNVEVLDLSVRAMNCLNNANIHLLWELCTKTESRLLKFRNFGKKSLDEIKEKIEKQGLTLGTELSEPLTAALEAEAKKMHGESGAEVK